MVAALPTVGQNPWGDQLNEYLSVEHNTDGTHKHSSSIKGFVNINDHGGTQGSGNSDDALVDANSELASIGGGELYFPPGVTHLDDPDSAVAANTHWKGAGKGASIVHWDTDAGAGVHALVCGGDNASPVSFSDLTLEGPGNVPGPGVKPCNMNGVKLGEKTWMRNVIVRNWNIGRTVNSNHNLADNCLITNCYWGDAYPESGWDSKGDQMYWYCDFTGCNLAGIHVAGSNTLDHVDLIHTHFGFGPSGILHEDYADGSPADSGFMVNVRIIGGAFELMGNECITDRSVSGNPSWLDCTIENTGYTDGGPSFKTTINDVHGNPYGRDYMINLAGPCVGGYVKNNSYPFTAGALGVYNFGSLSGGSTMPLVYGGYSQPGLLFPFPLNTYIDDLGGEFLSYTPSGTIVAGDLVEIVATAPYGICKRATGIFTTKPVFGVAATGSAGATTVMVQHVGGADGFRVFSETVATPGLELAQITGTYHKVGLKSTYPANPTIGFSRGTGGNAGATATVATILNVAR